MLGSSPSLLVLAAFATLAPAGEAEPAFIAVLPLQSEKPLDEGRAELVMQTVHSELPSQQIIVVPRTHVVTALTELGASCSGPEDCEAKVAQRLEARFLLRLSVNEPSPQDFDVKLTIVEPAAGTTIATFEETCQICSEADLKRLVQERTLDARVALERHLAPQEEETTTAPVAEAAPETRVEVQVAESSKLIPTGWGLFGAGAAATIGGVVMMSLTGSDAGCPNDPRGGQCIPLVYETLTPGAVVGGAGLALVATGIGLVIAGKKKNERAGQTARAQLRFGPGSLLLQGQF